MSPTRTMDAPAIGTVLLPKVSPNDETGKLVQRVKTPLNITPKVLRDMELAALDLDVPPTVALGDEPGVFIFEFDPDTAEKAIPGLLKIVFEEFAVRDQRHRNYQESGPVTAVYGELKQHG
ncbi:MAG: hypothetical protein JWN82_352 [Candidatus Saccharibacteria bacterium]|nr:hypothetical protein [Candidatus Saccharibacteria bacterium]